MESDPVLSGSVGFTAAPHFEERTEALHDAMQLEHPGKIVDEAKALIESVFRTILTNCYGSVAPGRRGEPTLPELYDQVKGALELSQDVETNTRLHEICSKLSLVIGQTRNSHGASSHGREGYEIAVLGLPEATFIARAAIAITELFIVRHQANADPGSRHRLIYEDYDEFNDYLDGNDEWPIIADRELRPSETLFKADAEAYRAALIDYNRTKDEV